MFASWIEFNTQTSSQMSDDRTSINVTISSLLPTAIVWPFGDQLIFRFSPGVSIVATHLAIRASQRRTVLSNEAVAKISLLIGCQHN
ncbi:hypothetical protein DERF_006450 [Dermatophagoides farinae]|uniref:Uncharacterized protein n=1 Tax=Dermatophagoides farinae TaxID=6954 RepID=A0A922I7T1_DERFA|nr:hypothetical protein DERF_006450 [Dermatophagoides farinae]